MVNGRVAHAYLFCGPPGCGKHTTGLALAAALNCQNAPGQGCASCSACHKIAAGIHPDVQTLERQGASRIIPIDTIRKTVIPQLGMAPHEGEARVFLIEEAAALQGPAANALLKTLEEPPERTHFILATTSPDQLLPTIRSRCQRINFAALSAQLRAEICTDEGGDEVAERARDLAEMLRRALAADDFDSLQRAASETAQAKEVIGAALDEFARQLHGEAMRAAMEDDLDRAVLRSRQAHAVLETQTAVSLQAHAQMALEAMVSTLRRTLP